MRFDKFLGRLEEGKVVQSTSLNEEFESSNWFYVPDREFLNNTMKVAVEELGSDQWKIHYFAEGSAEKKSSLDKARAAADESKEIERYMKLSERMLANEKAKKTKTLNEGENDKASLEGWNEVTSTKPLDFATALEKCVGLVEGNVDSEIEKEINQYTQ